MISESWTKPSIDSEFHLFRSRKAVTAMLGQISCRKLFNRPEGTPAVESTHSEPWECMFLVPGVEAVHPNAVLQTLGDIHRGSGAFCQPDRRLARLRQAAPDAYSDGLPRRAFHR
jgi:hypothetical protein